ncbi:MAG: ABC transporter permease subunit [Actinomycetota bacterium]|nr:ABC transporter permease subunit [Actinomycetota bacterium]
MTDLVASSRAELLRLTRWRVTWLLGGLWLALNVTFVYLIPYLSYRTGSGGEITDGQSPEQLLAEMMPATLAQSLTQGMPLFGGAIMLILGAMTVGGGYGWGTWKTVFVQSTSRTKAFLGTLVALAVVVVGTVVVTLVVDLGLAVLVAATESQPIDWPAVSDVATGIGAGILIFAMWTFAGVLLGTLARGPALAVGVGLVWAMALENLLAAASNLLDPLQPITDVLPGRTAGSLAGSFGGGGTPGVLTVIGGGTASVILVGYLLAFVVVSLTLVARRDVV